MLSRTDMISIEAGRSCSCPGQMTPQIHSLESRVLFAVSPATVLHINAGGPALVDSLGRGFAPDSCFSGGAAVLPPAYDVIGTEDDALFASYHGGADFSFAADVTNGNYQLFLEFSDPASTAAGQRLLDVSVEGNPVLDDFDIVAGAGVQTATARSARVVVSDGQLNLNFHGVVGDAIVSAIVLLPTDIPPESLPYSTQNLTDAERNALSLRQLKTIGNYLLLYSNDHKGKYPASLASLPESSDFGFLPVNPRTDTPTPRGVFSYLEAGAWSAQADDFVYLGAGKKSNVGDEVVIAYDNPQRVPGNINLLFGDGHTETWGRARAAATLGFADAELTRPPVFPPPISKDPLIVQSAARLKILNDALLRVYRDNRGRYPNSLGALFPFYVPAIENFINPRTGTQPPPAHWTTQQKVDWINGHAEYLLASPGAQWYRVGAVAISENPKSFADGINILTNDGQVSFYEMRWARELLALQTAPAVVRASLQYETSPISLDFQFSEDVSASLSASDLLLTNLTTGQVIPSDRFTLAYDWSTHTASFVYDMATWGPLPDGNYRGSIAAANVSDASATHPASDLAFGFFILAGDANHDRRVDSADLAILAMNWNGTAKTFSQGDFNFDGATDARDLEILAARYQASLPEARPPVRAPIRQPVSSVAALIFRPV